MNQKEICRTNAETEIHRFIAENPKCCAKDIAAGISKEKSIIYARLAVLVDQGKILADRPDRSTTTFYTSLKPPAQLIGLEPTESCIPPRLIMSRLWLPGHLELSA